MSGNFHNAIKKFEKEDLCIGHNIDIVGCLNVNDFSGNTYIHHELKNDMRQIYWFILLRINSDKIELINFDIRDVSQYSEVRLNKGIEDIYTKNPLACAARFINKVYKKNSENDLFEIIKNAKKEDILKRKAVIQSKVTDECSLDDGYSF